MLKPKLLSALLICGFLTACSTHWNSRQNMRHTVFDIALIGDVPYGADAIQRGFPNMIREINQADVAFVVHDGDIKAGATPCTDELFHKVYNDFQSFKHPLFFTFGDNEWADCGKIKTNAFNPEERLSKLREIFCQGEQSLGKRTLPLTRQGGQYSKYRENFRWHYGNVLFVGLNVPAYNNYGQPDYPERNRANLAWLREGFSLAKQEHRHGLMIIIQANPQFDEPSTNRVRAGFNEMIKVLEQETLAFKKPVVLVHGDSHYFRIDKPLMSSKSGRRIENFTRVETFGNPDVHWLRATVDWRDPNLFSFRQEIIRDNLVDHTVKPKP